MRIFIDTEFLNLGSGAPIYPISIGMVTEKGDEFYGINVDAPLGLMWANRFIRQNVWPHLPLVGLAGAGGNYAGTLDWDHEHPDIEHVRQLQNLREDVYQFIVQDGEPQLWGSFSGFDYVVLSQLFGTFDDHRTGVPMFINDVQQYRTSLAGMARPVPDEHRDGLRRHHALDDAKATQREFMWHSATVVQQLLGQPE